MEDDPDSDFTSSPFFRFRWDVFLSFRGEDTRHNFTHRLYNELVRNGIRTFRDDDELDRGEEIAPSLLTAIEDSALSIAVISRNYATSRWCLEELAKIFECRRLMLPVFYQVDPSDVRRQKGPFEEAFRNHERQFGEDSEKVLRWKKAMEKAGGISGWDSKNWEESQLIQSLIKKISIKLSNTPLEVAKHPIGLNSRVDEVMRMLDIKSSSVQVVGFHGMGGVGKTTLAKAVYNKIASQFEHRIFISNIRTIAKQCNGLIALQKIIIRDLCKKTIPVDEVGEGIAAIREGIHEKRVLVVLDDVDDVSQLDALAIERDHFDVGSRIIITTRNNKVLMQHLVNKIYEVKELNPGESLQLFSSCAFGKERPPEAFSSLSLQVVSCTGRLPLALEVLGAFLSDKRRIEEWKDELEKLKKITPGNLHEVLKTSFDGLDEQEKCIFLDIACFFVEMDMKRESVIDILKGCGFNAEIAITVLTAKCLIKIISDATVWMHDQLRDMGRQIVRQESLSDLGMRSRLWDHDEIMSVLKYEKGTRSIQGIVLDFNKNSVQFLSSKDISEVTNGRRPSITSTIMSLKKKFRYHSDQEVEEKQVKEVKLCTKPFAPMINLRLLQINHANLEGKFKLIPGELKWLQWKGCPLETLPSDFCPRELAVLDLTESKIKNMAEKLMILNLQSCYNLTATPDFSGHPHLEKVILENCRNLSEIKSIGDARSLRILNLRACPNLVELPNDISGLRCLESLNLSGCSRLKELPENLKSMKSLRELFVGGTAIVKLPDSIFHLTKLERLNLDGCTLLEQLPKFIGKLGSLRELSLNDCNLKEIPTSVGSLEKLETLSLMRCRSLDAIPDSIGKLESLLELLLNSCTIKELPASIGSLSHLKCLSVSSCKFLNRLHASIGGLASMVELQLDSSSIIELPDDIGTLKLLKKLEMRNCTLLSWLPDSIGNMFSLTTLVLTNAIIKELPESIGLLENLEILNVNQCKQLIRLPASIGKLKCLREILMADTGVAELPEEFGMLSSLTVLKMAKRQHLVEPQNIGEHTELTVLNAQKRSKIVLPASFSRLSLLRNLDVCSCKISGIIPDEFEKLSSLEDLNLGHNNFCHLPSSLRGLSILTKLSLTHCMELKSLPPLPSNLTFVDVTNCSALESISDLSNLEHLQELRLTNCMKVKDIPGLECLKSLKRLYMSGCTACYSCVKRRLPKVAFRNLRNLSVPGSEIPNWFSPEVPSFSNCKNRKIKGLIICVVVSLDQQTQDDFRDKVPSIVDIQAKILRDNSTIFSTVLYLMGVPKTDEDQFYLCRYLDFNPLVSLLKDGDKIQVTMRDPPIFNGLQLKQYGIHLVFEDDDDGDNEDDEELLDETEQSVSERLAKFFASLEQGTEHARSSDAGSGAAAQTIQEFEGRKDNNKPGKSFASSERGTARARSSDADSGEAAHTIEEFEVRKDNIKPWKSYLGVGMVIAALMLVVSPSSLGAAALCTMLAVFLVSFIICTW